MKGKLYALAAIAALLLVGCTPPPNEPSDININVTNNNTNNNGGGGTPGASPSPVAGALHHVGIGAFGESACEAGKTPAGHERDNDGRVGCTVNLTCSGFDANGNEIQNEDVTGASPEVFRAISGENVVRVSVPSNDYNLDVRCVAPGPAVFECVLKGISSNAGRNGPYRLTCVP
jgi:hypothetical protein